MAKKQQKEPKEMADLRECLYDLDNVERYLENCIHREVEIDPSIGLVLVKGVNKKIDYFQDKYGFEVEREDLFTPEKLIGFVSMVASKGI